MSEKTIKKARKVKLNPELSSHVIGAHNIDEVIAGIVKQDVEPQFLVIDLFCGAGGTSTGFDMANGLALVIACVNHDHMAIKSHWSNYPHVAHFEEDIRILDLRPMVKLLKYYRKLYPNAKVILWASLECTNFSKAKGGQPRDADSRTLADHLHRYVDALKPDYVQIENVVEFMSWGPLISKVIKTDEGYSCCPVQIVPNWEYSADYDEDAAPDWVEVDGLLLDMNEVKARTQVGWKVLWQGVPESKKNGRDFMRWCREMDAHGYRHEWRELNSADFGAYTSRNRLFGIFARPSLPIGWPLATHSKKVTKGGMFGSLQPWKAVKEVLDFSDEGESIFTRKKPLSEKTLERVYAGLVKYVAGGKDAYMIKYMGNDSKTGINNGKSLDEPCVTIATSNRLGLVQTSFITQRNSGNPEGRVVDLDGPARTLTSTAGNQDLVQASFIAKYYSGKPEGKVISVNGPAGTICTVDTQALVNAQFLHAYYGNGDNNTSVNSPAPTIPTKDRCALVQPFFFIDKQYSGNGNNANHQSIEQPAGSILANDKHCLVTAERSFITPTNFDNQPTSIEQPLGTITANRKWHYLVNPSWGGNPGSTDEPSPVIVARQDKAPLYLVISESGDIAIRADENDSPCMRKIKEFMVLYRIVDIKMRMLKVLELLKIQGFPAGYKLQGNQSDQKKFIGNSVVPHVVRSWIEAMSENLISKSQAA